MAQRAGVGRAVDPEYRTSTEIMTKSGGIFWGLVLLIVGLLWFAATAGWVPFTMDLLLPFLVILAGLYLLITKFMK